MQLTFVLAAVTMQVHSIRHLKLIGYCHVVGIVDTAPHSPFPVFGCVLTLPNTPQARCHAALKEDITGCLPAVCAVVIAGACLLRPSGANTDGAGAVRVPSLVWLSYRSFKGIVP